MFSELQALRLLSDISTDEIRNNLEAAGIDTLGLDDQEVYELALETLTDY